MSKRWNMFLLALLTLSALAGCASREQVAGNRRNSAAAAAGDGSPVRPASVAQIDEERRLDIGELVYAATMGRGRNGGDGTGS